jgi:acetyl-CoA C-acetyltransferase
VSPGAFIVGAYEHPDRRGSHRTLPQLHAEAAAGALADAGLSLSDVDAYFCDSSVPGLGPMGMIEYLGIDVRLASSSDIGGATYLSAVAHAALAIGAGDCHVALCTMAGYARPSAGPGEPPREPASDFEESWGITTAAHNYALAAMRHMYEFGTTSAQLAEVKVAASLHAQHNPHAALPAPVSVEEVLASPMISDPLHRLDCCLNTDGAAAVVVASTEVAARLDRTAVAILGHGEAHQNTRNGRVDLVHTAAVRSGPRAFDAAGLAPADIDYASIYDSFTITVIETIEDLGFCPKGQGGRYAQEQNLRAPHGALPLNTDGGSLCNNHPGGRGGMVRIVEAVRQLRGEAHPALQVPDCRFALVHGTGGRISTRSSSSTLILGRESR